MTSSSRRKPRTTRRNTPSPSEAGRRCPARAGWLVAGAALVTLLALLAGAETVHGAEWRAFLEAPESLLCAVTPVFSENPPETEDAASAEPEPGLLLAEAAGDASANAPQVTDLAASPESPADGGDGEDDTPARREPCAEERGDCTEALDRLRKDKLTGIDLDIRVGGRPGNDYPCECRLEGETFEPRRFATTMFTWKAPGYCHKPLYFEDWELERYGHSYGALDPVLSAAHFFTTLPVLPYKMGVELPWECVYPLGYYRPGDCAPWTIPAIPISFRGMAVEAATVTGLVFLLP